MGYAIIKKEYYDIIGVGSFSKADAVALRDALNVALLETSFKSKRVTFQDGWGDTWVEQADGSWRQLEHGSDPTGEVYARDINPYGSVEDLISAFGTWS